MWTFDFGVNRPSKVFYAPEVFGEMCQPVWECRIFVGSLLDLLTITKEGS